MSTQTGHPDWVYWGHWLFLVVSSLAQEQPPFVAYSWTTTIQRGHWPLTLFYISNVAVNPRIFVSGSCSLFHNHMDTNRATCRVILLFLPLTHNLGLHNLTFHTHQEDPINNTTCGEGAAHSISCAPVLSDINWSRMLVRKRQPPLPWGYPPHSYGHDGQGEHIPLVCIYTYAQWQQLGHESRLGKATTVLTEKNPPHPPILSIVKLQ
jgi:hypothetical protein